MATTPDEETRDKLLKAVKKEVKSLMEESVTKKFVHEESSCLTALCGAVEACLLHGLRKRALGLFKNSTTTALLHKVSKSCEPAALVIKTLSDVEQNNENARKSLDDNRNQTPRKPVYNQKYLWIRLALLEKQLAKIIDHLAEHNSKYYEKEALVADPCDGPLLASLLVGPCALDFTKMKTCDHYWTDPPADELVQRHRIHSNHIRPDSPKRPGLQVATMVRRHTSSSSEESMRAAPLSAKEYVESLHQNSKTTLLYGKNNVIVQPKEDVSALPGYLSLHQGPEGLSVKWTPNQLMNGCCNDEAAEQQIDKRPIYAKYHQANLRKNMKVLYWDYAVTVMLDEIVYLHCHQQADCGGTIVLVGQDGVQRPPIHFPKGGHLLAFLSCLENGLLPHGQLDPPLWSQRGKGKVFPKLKRKGSQLQKSPQGGSNSSIEQQPSIDDTSIAGALMSEDDETTDYVFRIITTFRPEHLPAEMVDPRAKESSGPISFPWWKRDPTPAAPPPSLSSSTSSKPSTPMPVLPPMESGDIHTYVVAQQSNGGGGGGEQHVIRVPGGREGEHRSAVQQLCDTMKTQIVSRAFYGWLSYCRHLKTVRTHLSGLVNTTIISIEDPADASAGLTVDVWRAMEKDGVVANGTEVYRLVYYGGCDPSIRAEVWPYLLGHYEFGSTATEREQFEDGVKQQYEKTMAEWLAVEAIVRQRDKEIMAANLAKLSSENSQDGHIPLMRKDSSLSNDVFESMDSDDFSHPETVPEETSSQLVTPTGEHPSRQISMETEHPTVAAVKGGTGGGGLGPHSPDEGIGDSIGGRGSSSTSWADAVSRRSDSCDTDKNVDALRSESDDTAVEGGLQPKSVIITNPSVDVREIEEDVLQEEEEGDGDLPDLPPPEKLLSTSTAEDGEHLSASRESLLASPVSVASNGGVYAQELLDNVALNLHRIDKDVQRCDRNYAYFNTANLDKLRNIMCTYVWEHLEVGYVQGMCDLVAPLLVILDDEAKAYSCFCHLMKRMSSNFPHGGAMDTHFANMRSLIQILDPELFEHMHQNGDYTHFYFCYRWFLLDFKRELVYEDIFSVWESIWSAKFISSRHFVLFMALAMVEYYRDIIIDNNMDFTDIIKFFNEMAERHPAKQVLQISRDLVYKLQDLIDNK